MSSRVDYRVPPQISMDDWNRYAARFEVRDDGIAFDKIYADIIAEKTAGAKTKVQNDLVVSGSLDFGGGVIRGSLSPDATQTYNLGTDYYNEFLTMAALYFRCEGPGYILVRNWSFNQMELVANNGLYIRPMMNADSANTALDSLVLQFEGRYWDGTQAQPVSAALRLLVLDTAGRNRLTLDGRLQLSSDSDVASDETALLIRVNKGGTFSLERVSLGPVDSGGVGYRVLRVPN